ncbi:MAG: type VI secretion system tip protein TssI/VgrG [Polyangiaceae bacterium]
MPQSSDGEGTLPLRLALESTTLPRFDVIEADATFSLTECFEFRLVLATPKADVSVRELLGTALLLYLDEEAFVPRVRGMIRRARTITIEPTGISHYEVWIVPPLWRLSKRTNHRIFRDASVLDIADILLAEHGLEPLLRGSHEAPVREYTVQYGETDLHLLQRLLADEGWVSVPTLESGRLRILQDSTREPIPLPAPLPYQPAGVSSGEPHAFGVHLARDVRSGKCTVVDHDADNPNYVIEGSFDEQMDLDLEDYVFEVGEVKTGDDAGLRARDRFHRQSSPSEHLAFLASCLVPVGTTVRITGHPRVEVEEPHLVTRAKAEWRSGRGRVIRHAHECLDTKSPFKPPLLDKPRIASVQTARVVGAPGVEIDVDALGRVEVEFFWDRRRLGTLGTSRRVCLSQAWAGVGHGLFAAPRVGDEVLIGYLDGDADEPVVIGRVHNPVRPPPTQLPENKTVSVWRTRSSPGGEGYNEILLDDLAGAERFAIHAARDHSTVVEHDATTLVRHDETREVHGDFTSRTKGHGDMRYEAGFAIATAERGTITGHDIEVRATSHDTRVQTTHSTSSGEIELSSLGKLALQGKDVTVTGGASITLSVGGSSIVIKDSSIAISAQTIAISAKGTCAINGTPIDLNC